MSKCIIWNKNTKLVWNDYKGIVPLVTTHEAGSYLWINYNSKEFREFIEINLGTYFVPDSSWFSRQRASYYLLNHEIRHFDLAEVTVRKFRKYITNWKGNDITSFDSYLDANQIKYLFDSAQKQYDYETNHSLNKLEQEKWNIKIDSLLEAYKDYGNPELKIRRTFSTSHPWK